MALTPVEIRHSTPPRTLPRLRGRGHGQAARGDRRELRGRLARARRPRGQGRDSSRPTSYGYRELRGRSYSTTLSRGAGVGPDARPGAREAELILSATHADLADPTVALQLETDLVRFRELEALLRTTLVSAEQASAQTRDQAQREAELILSEAHAEAREIQRRALAENERLQQESRRLRLQLQEALSAFGEPEQATAPEPPATADESTEETDERSWYGLPDANAA